MRPIKTLRRVIENTDRVAENTDRIQAATIRLQEAADNESTVLNECLKQLQEAADNLATNLNDKLGGLQGSLDNESTVLNESLQRLQEAADNQSTTVNRNFDKVVETLENQSNAINMHLKEVIRAITNQATGSNLRLDHLIGARSSNFLLKNGRDANSLTEERPRQGDIELIERYSRDWQANANSYQKALPDIRRAARRLLQVLEHPGGSYDISDDELRRLHDVDREVACLARQALFFPEMFHGVTLRSDGSLEPLDASDAEHLRANGLLGVGDRRALHQIYERLIASTRSIIRVAEIGSAAGRGSTPIAGEYIKRVGGTLYCIDPWVGSWYFAFLTNVRIFDLEGTVVPIRSASAPAASLFDDGSLDAVFVDGSHIYEDVLADIDAYLPKVRKGGVIFGHDLLDLPSRFDRSELLSIAAVNNADANYKNSNGEVERVNVHPGVILAVQDRFGDDVELFGEESVVWAKQL
jgi:predicted O-methyltransferase YrrM